MNKVQLAKEVIQKLCNNKFKVKEIVKSNGRTNPLFYFVKNNEKYFFRICEAGKKENVKDPSVIWFELGKKEIENAELDSTFLDNLYYIIIDFRPQNGQTLIFILAKLNKTNYSAHGKDNSFHFYREDYYGFFNTPSIEELTKKIIEGN